MLLSTEQRANIKAWVDAMRSGRYTHTKGSTGHSFYTTKEGCAIQVVLVENGFANVEDFGGPAYQNMFSVNGPLGTVLLDVDAVWINDQADSYEPVCVALEKYLENTQ